MHYGQYIRAALLLSTSFTIHRPCTPTPCISVPHLPRALSWPHRTLLVSKKTSYQPEKARMPGSTATPHPRSIPSFPKPHYRRVPQAPRPDIHVFLPPPPYTESTSFLAVPNNTPATTPPLPPLSSSSSSDDSVALSTPNGVGLHAQSRSGLVGLGFEGLEKGRGGVFDGLGRLSDGFRLSDSSSSQDSSHRSSDPPRTQIQSKAASTRPKKRHDVFFPCPHHSRSLSPVSFLAQALPNTAMLQFRIRRRVEAGSPTPAPDMKFDPSRSTVSTELKRAAGMERRVSLSRYGSGRVAWRV
ncbi:uncharacterized protein EDB91DRAFT_646522 [Suillus paluster]|uniref:uncharacterized protein n=1 Tax=Suillus paluster TaxID=48578 RepID=UPI001B862EB2|nr:uncharacterized protein EDB91DRAFT_646522 [Suillus paluster]KAG1733215.1 hypothetical protein EDB91DRAFT_646522 [Suillus paluster]